MHIIMYPEDQIFLKQVNSNEMLFDFKNIVLRTCQWTFYLLNICLLNFLPNRYDNLC